MPFDAMPVVTDPLTEDGFRAWLKSKPRHRLVSDYGKGCPVAVYLGRNGAAAVVGTTTWAYKSSPISPGAPSQDMPAWAEMFIGGVDSRQRSGISWERLTVGEALHILDWTGK